ncbi:MULTISPECIES: hypothetical protein [Pseudomonas]|uniref:Phage replication protein n=1 Tax=Pseudomonas lutea TaxID=243924 RepID=A0A9X8MHW1_9PSED|nr:MULTISPECIES: hypothetical protein [Pseudomonas]SER51860.1 hypothetical protein SAMN05216409_1334 [Pseudomonas lutea]
MANQWFRMYSEFATDPKVQMLSESDQRRFIMLLCLRCSNGDVTLHDEEVAFQLRISNEEWNKTKRILIDRGLIDEDAKPCAWDKRQYVSDSSTARVAAHRASKKKARKQACNVSVTPPDTDTDTDTDTEQEPPLPPEGEKPTKPASGFDPIQACPANVSPAVWAKWVQCRKEQGKPLKKTTCEAQAKLLEDHPDPDAVVQASINAGWQGLFPQGLANVHPISDASRPRIVKGTRDTKPPKTRPGDFHHWNMAENRWELMNEEWNEPNSGKSWEYLRRIGEA